MIKKIKVKNFKSFKDMELSLGKVNILIGANGSGKSNFVDIFRFLKDIIKEGWDNAISLHGDKYLRNVNINTSENLLIEIEEIPYIVNIEFTEDGYGYAKITHKDQTVEYIPNIDKPGKTIKLSINETLKLSDKQAIEQTDAKTGERLDYLPGGSLRGVFRSYSEDIINEKTFSIFDFNPKLSHIALPIANKADLDEDGGNLSAVIKMILDDPEKKRMFLNLVTYLLPYIEDIEVDKFTETHFYLKIKETYSEKHYLPAPLISDGTINALGLIVALYFQESPLIIIEEPDRGFHPSLISRVVGMMKDAAENGNKQIIVTTHNPEMVKHADPKDVLLVSRDEKGFSSIKRPYRKNDVKVFLKNGMRFEDLYVDSLLEI